MERELPPWAERQHLDMQVIRTIAGLLFDNQITITGSAATQGPSTTGFARRGRRIGSEPKQT